MAADHRQRHTGEEAAQCRFRRVEVGVGIEPDRAAARVLEAGDDTQGGVARASEDDGKLPRIDALRTTGASCLFTRAAEAAVSRNGSPRSIVSSVAPMPRAARTRLAPASSKRFGPRLDPCRSSPAMYGTWIRQTPVASLVRSGALGWACPESYLERPGNRRDYRRDGRTAPPGRDGSGDRGSPARQGEDRPVDIDGAQPGDGRAGKGGGARGRRRDRRARSAQRRDPLSMPAERGQRLPSLHAGTTQSADT
jgi:hypothetical protein